MIHIYLLVLIKGVPVCMCVHICVSYQFYFIF